MIELSMFINCLEISSQRCKAGGKFHWFPHLGARCLLTCCSFCKGWHLFRYNTSVHKLIFIGMSCPRITVFQELFFLPEKSFKCEIPDRQQCLQHVFMISCSWFSSVLKPKRRVLSFAPNPYFCHLPCAVTGNKAAARQTEPDHQSNRKLTLVIGWSCNSVNCEREMGGTKQ